MRISTKFGIAMMLLMTCSFLATRIFKPKAVGKTISNLKWSECEGTGSKYVDVQSVEVSGNFLIGTIVSVIMYGTVKTPFLAASVEGSLKYGFLTLYTETVVRNPPTNYSDGPVKEGKSILIEQDLPNGSYTVISRINDPDGKKLQCVQATYKLSS